jgi:archaeosine synthase alpha-subunit
MNFRVHNRDGPARIGQLTIDKKNVVTPNILFLHTSRCKAPEFSDILLTNETKKTNIFTVRIGDSIFSAGEKKEKKEVLMNDYLIYPKDVAKELHLNALTKNKNLDCFLIPAKKELISEIVKDTDVNLSIVTNAAQLFSQQSHFVDFITELREKIGYQKLIYIPCVGDPTSIALLTYLGVDFFDSFSSVMAARNETLLFPIGPCRKNQLPELPCNCPTCIKIKDASVMKYEEILKHNYSTVLCEIKQVRNAIAAGSLRELVETRVRTNPLLASMLRTLDLHHYQFLEERTPIVRKQPLLATTIDALNRPEVRRFQERVIQRFEKPATTKVLLLLPCSAKKPYSFSKSHTLFRETIQSVENPWVVHEVILTSPLGLVPRELELTYPASSYDIAVTGDWDEDEKHMIRSLLQNYLRKNTYETVIMHIPRVMQEFVADLLKKPLSTCIDSPTSKESLQQLSKVLQKATTNFTRVQPAQRTFENIKSLACYQFGKPLAERLLIDCSIKGKYPYQKIIHRGSQLGMITEERGLISLTLDGAKRLVDEEQYWVEIFDDFMLKGSVFVPGVKNADESIRIGDEVLIRKNKQLCGVGVALMNGKEMNESRQGEAVKIRHHI